MKTDPIATTPVPPELISNPITTLEEAKAFFVSMYDAGLLCAPSRTSWDSLKDRATRAECRTIDERMRECQLAFHLAGELSAKFIRTMNDGRPGMPPAVLVPAAREIKTKRIGGKVRVTEEECRMIHRAREAATRNPSLP